MSNLANTSAALDKLATSLNSLYTQMEKCYVTVCETMGAAREHFDDDAEFWSWVEDTTPFKSRIYRCHPVFSTQVFTLITAFHITFLIVLSTDSIIPSVSMTSRPSSSEQ
mgnify:CR=1 FL=1